MQSRQFRTEESVFFTAIEEWAKIESNIQRWVSAKQMHQECQKLLFGDEKPHYFWPETPKRFAGLIMRHWYYLYAVFGMTMKYDLHSKTNRYLMDHGRGDNTWFGG